MQPYGGSNHGMHLPLHKGTEVLLTFIDGDPDRPVIAGVVPNPEHPSPVSEGNQTQARITTAGGNKIHIEDQAGNRRILMQSPTADSFIRLGAPNDPEPKWGEKAVWKKDVPEKDGIVMATTQGFDCKAEVANTIVLGENSSITVVLDATSVFAGRIDMTLGNRLNLALFTQTDIKAGWHWKGGPGFTEMVGWEQRVIEERIDSIAAQQAVQAKIDKMTGQVNKAIGQATRVETKLARAVGQANTASENLEQVAGAAQTVNGQLSRVVQQADDVNGQITDAIGNAGRARTRLTRAVGDANTVAGQLTRAATSLNTQAVEVFRVAGIDSTL
jgi:type VI secretion system secreted protein VgrG